MDKNKNINIEGTPNDGCSEESESFEKVLSSVGGFGKYQWLLWLITSGSGFFIAFNNVSNAFLAASPNHWCQHPGNENMSIEMFREMRENDTDLHSILPECHYYDIEFDTLLAYWEEGRSPSNDSIPTIKCESWIYDTSTFQSTIATEWNLVCHNKWMMSTVQASTMVGFLLGGVVFSELSDMYGRRALVLSSSIGMIISSIVLAFTYHYEIHVLLKLIQGSFAAGIYLPNFVLLMEASGEKARTILGVLYQGMFGVGLIVLPGVAYLFRNWRDLQLALFVPSIAFLVYYWILPESPRWLLLRGRTEEATETIKNISEVNKKKTDEEKISNLISQIKVEAPKNHNLAKMILYFFKNQAILFRTPVLRRRSCIIFFEWFVVGFVYYGLVFNSANMNISSFVLVLISGISEIAAVIIASLTTQRYGRRLNLLALLVICGIACIGIIFIPKDMGWLNLALATIGKLANAAAFAVVYIYSAELVPTNVRNICVGASSLWARVGSIIAPYVVDLLGDLHNAIPSTLFGICSILGGLLCLLLPETGGKGLPASIEEIEALQR